MPLPKWAAKIIFQTMEGAMTTDRSEPYPFVSKVIDLFGDWLKQRRQLSELAEYEAYPGELDRIAREFGMTPADLDRLVRQGSHSADELPKMLEALGIDEAAIRRAEPALLRDMERVCSFCQHKRQCHHELAVGTAAANYEEYCGNADAIDTLRFKS
jgi:transcriptional regulator with XRE-family HTH domain